MNRQPAANRRCNEAGASTIRRPSPHRWVAALLLALTAPACADVDPAALDGTWTLSYGNRSSTLVVAGGTGTLRYFAMNAAQQRNSCIGPTFPVAVTAVDGELQLAVNASNVLRGCEDVKLKVVVGDDKLPVGTFPSGTVAKFTRQ